MLDQKIAHAKEARNSQPFRQPRMQVGGGKPKRRPASLQISTYLIQSDYEMLGAVAEQLHMSRGALLLALHEFRTTDFGGMAIASNMREVEALLLGED